MSEFERPIVTIDIVILTILDGVFSVALLPRKAEPYQGALALVGGFVHAEEDADADAAAHRVLAEKAELKGVYIEQLQTFASAGRDPRGWSVSIVYLALLPYDLLARQGADGFVVMPVDEAKDLPFDHDDIVAAAVSRMRGKGAYSTLPARLLGDKFSLSELQSTYEIVRDETLDTSSFRRKMVELRAIKEVDGKPPRTGEARRPARLYSIAEGTGLFDRRI